MRKSAEETKTNMEGQMQNLHNQLADLQNSLKLAHNSKNQAVANARKEERRAAEAHIKVLKSRHSKDLTKVETTSYNEASDDAAIEIIKIKDMIYKAGYEFGLSAAGILEGDELFDKTVLCPPNLFAQPPPIFEEEQEDGNEIVKDDQAVNVVTDNPEVMPKFELKAKTLQAPLKA